MVAVNWRYAASLADAKNETKQTQKSTVAPIVYRYVHKRIHVPHFYLACSLFYFYFSQSLFIENIWHILVELYLLVVCVCIDVHVPGQCLIVKWIESYNYYLYHYYYYYYYGYEWALNVEVQSNANTNVIILLLSTRLWCQSAVFYGIIQYVIHY